jgi:hypothetical protein
VELVEYTPRKMWSWPPAPRFSWSGVRGARYVWHRRAGAELEKREQSSPKHPLTLRLSVSSVGPRPRLHLFPNEPGTRARLLPLRPSSFGPGPRVPFPRPHPPPPPTRQRRRRTGTQETPLASPLSSPRQRRPVASSDLSTRAPSRFPSLFFPPGPRPSPPL